MLKECRYIKTNGLKCQSPAMRDSQFCYFHGRRRIYVSSRPASTNQKLKLPPLNDSASIRAALGKVIRALAAGRIDAKRAGNLLYALQMARDCL